VNGTPRRPRGIVACLVAVAFLVAAVLVSTLVGAADLNPLSTVAALADRIPFVHLPSGLGPVDQAVLFQIRLPRIVLGAMVGGLLAVAGAGYQGVFRNPLVDSGMLGASAGAGLGATIAIVYLSGLGPAAVPAAAFAGSLAGVAVAYLAGTVSGSGPATLPAVGVGPGAGLLLAARLAVRGDLVAGAGDPAVRGGQHGGRAAARTVARCAVRRRRRGPHAGRAS
jgi:iron complex transport system permease protein